MSKPVLRVVSPSATPEEVAAIVAALESCVAADAGAAAAAPPDPTMREWVHGSRLTARRAGLQRGPWRLSGRIGRRARA
jgi:hypothetical protein